MPGERPWPSGATRAAWGHGAAIFGSGHRDLVEVLDMGRKAGLQNSIETGRPFVVLEGALGFTGAELARLGFQPGSERELAGGITVVTYAGATGSVPLVKLDEAMRFLADSSVFDVLRSLTPDGSVVATGYPSTMRDVNLASPDAVEPLGGNGPLTPTVFDATILRGRRRSMAYIYIAATVLLTSYGQLILKREINTVGDVPDGRDLIPFLVTDVLFRPLVISGFAAALLAALSWMAALTKLDLSIAYPFMSLNFVLVGLLAVPFFGDTFGPSKILGLALISAGLVAIGTSS